ncbi:hypothetical protein CAL29_25355 [Bordetella genomosp. 10]|uniref:ABC transporter substrate-binding protein n=1 Tax=Bordetella genomosp. 10 TaxID=1416804 RepID=A0A261S256_9BORD|nr:tripartite tricarboxylate transporter substrate binding protein [Bordetella genomosp. 10]OZI31255.1 hypothetical protein CAL29_25355 [Bordetella genomosp. 10]
MLRSKRACLKGLLAVAACSLLNAARAVAAPAYPAKPIRLLVPFAPGGSTDALARILAKGLSARLGESVVVENRPGAGGNIAMGAAARAQPDGYTLLIVSSSLVINPGLYAAIPYDPIKSFAPITYLAAAPSLLIVNAREHAGSVGELVAEMKARPGAYNYSSPGIGTAQHLAGELFRLTTGVALAHIPYNGAGPSVAAVAAGDVQMGLASLPAALPLVQSGAVRALAITTRMRSPAAPDIPTFAEAGYAAVESDHLQGLLAPAGTPPAIVQQLSKATDAVLAQPETARQLVDLGFIVGGGTPEEFQREIARQLQKWPAIVRQAGVKVE